MMFENCRECGRTKAVGALCPGCMQPSRPSPSFEERGRRIGALVDRKNAAYGDSFAKSGDVLAILYPDGVKPSQYRDMLAITRIIDKLFRWANHRDGENPADDLAGYGIVAGGKEESA